jgi:AcrR family transcriptional regulator
MTKSAIQLRVEADLAVRDPSSQIDDRQQWILAAAVQECAQVGFKSASIASIAKSARVSTATLYRFYKDKTDLLFQCVSYVIPMLAQSMTQQIHAPDPFQTIKAMLIAHGEAFGDPFMGWLYRLYINSDDYENSGQLLMIARAGRTLTQAHWSAKLSELERQGYLMKSDHDVTINLLLGQIERRTILAQLLYGEDDVSEPSLENAAEFAATGLFANLGTPAFCELQR